MTRGDEEGACPENYQPCIADASPANTLCYKEDEMENCPITEIMMVLSNLSSKYSDVGYTIVPFNSTTSVAYTTQTDSLPPTSIQIGF